MNRLVLEAVTCVRQGRALFADLSFSLGRGEAIVISGPNGVGKSSLIRIAAGLLRPAAGSVIVTGARALLAEAAALDGDRTVAAALAFWAAFDRGAGDHALAQSGLAYLADVPVRLLSTGQRRRVAFARVLASGAPIWLLDEPANGLDAPAVARLETMIARHREGGGIVLVATHQPLAMAGAQEMIL